MPDSFTAEEEQFANAEGRQRMIDIIQGVPPHLLGQRRAALDEALSRPRVNPDRPPVRDPMSRKREPIRPDLALLLTRQTAGNATPNRQPLLSSNATEDRLLARPLLIG